ncbi:hypothetical protein BC937DRAFT_94116 [Endogone sp. FLAS-F59071]|nr:hypothetical protein BC937DRAFT_94116 [Endogone sp. FLAS-F59071]|eukprot:RUS22997.1 hypothetical protein BC937DRAFT_94116 [Endogone sp. FLAS-F59071]
MMLRDCYRSTFPLPLSTLVSVKMAQPNERIPPRVPRNIALSRLNIFSSPDSEWRELGLTAQLWRHRVDSDEFIRLESFSVPDLKRIPFEQAVLNKFTPVKKGWSFGPSWSTHWFHVHIIIPSGWIGEEVQLQWDANCEGLIFSTDGEPLQGLTGGNSQARHEFTITHLALPGQKFEYYIEMAANGMFGVGGTGMVPDPNRRFTLQTADLVVANKKAWALYHDFELIRNFIFNTPENTQRQHEALYAANEIVNVFKPGDDKSIEKGLRIAAEWLSKTGGEGQHHIIAIGNCHIDTAWLWPFAETKRKVARSWSSQVRLMERYPEYKFACSQVQQYEFLLENYPVLFEKVKERVRSGQFIPIGGSWVESDTNMPSGEALIRQMLLGQRFYEKHFGKRVKTYWLPDSFGYSGQLPQILKASGIDYFFTQKLSWNNINRFPLTTFYWRGIDGSKVLAHLSPANTYCADVRPHELQACINNNNDLDYTNESLLLFGYGDGGGGPNAEMLERLERLRNVDGLPTVKSGDPTEFFERIEKYSKPLSSYRGELYAEFHRGTYTTQALVKRGNRKNELLLRDVELLGTLASQRDPKGYCYPKKQLERMWKIVCLNQFHDCLPGSSIGMVYEDIHKSQRELAAEAFSLRHEALGKVLGLTGTQSLDEKRVVVFNTLAWDRTEIIKVPVEDGMPQLQQYSAVENAGYVLADNVSALGQTSYMFDRKIDVEPVTVETTHKGDFVLRNQYLEVIFDNKGHLISLFDRAQGRELVPEGRRGNVFQLYEDIPTGWDGNCKIIPQSIVS